MIIVKVLKGKFKNRVGKVVLKTDNGWYHVKMGKETVKFRKTDIKPATQRELTQGEKEAKRIDKVYKQKLQQQENDTRKLHELLRTNPGDKQVRKLVISLAKSGVTINEMMYPKRKTVRKTKPKTRPRRSSLRSKVLTKNSLKI